ncbi:unnamed protein product [Alternaria burnsii]|nr:unnamed protein product [Alternaria burnsii]
MRSLFDKRPTMRNIIMVLNMKFADLVTAPAPHNRRNFLCQPPNHNSARWMKATLRISSLSAALQHRYRG